MSKKKTKIPGPQASFAEILDHYTREASKERASNYFPLRPSSAGKCERRLAYDLANFRGIRSDEPEIFEPHVTRLLDLGHFVESHLLKQFYYAFKQADSGLQIKYKQQTLGFFNLPHADEYIEGSLDAVFVSPKWKAVIDVKSAKDNWSTYFKTKWKQKIEEFRKDPLVTEIDDNSFYIDDIEAYRKTCKDASFLSNMLQLNMYFNSECGFLRDRGVSFCSLIYYSKNSSEVREVRFKPSKETYQYVKDKFLRVSEAVDLHKDPERVEKEFALGSFSCAFCPYSKECWGDKVDSKKEYFKTWPKKKWPKDADRLAEEKELRSYLETIQEANSKIEEKKAAEQEIIKILDKRKVSKIRFDENNIYEVKQLKTGGVGGGPRRVLRRGKL